ncbi:MAG: ATP-binding protein [Syntrophomonadaceae bacterium]|nr:ATP-binding protein [Syntrophomonadaceae bacterium]
MQLQRLIIYRNLLNDKVIRQMQELEDMSSSPSHASRENCFYDICSELIRYSEKQQMDGDVWKNYLLGLLANDENIFSLAGERSAEVSPGLYQLALRDMEIILEAYHWDWLALVKPMARDTPWFSGFEPGNAKPAPNHYQQSLKRLKQIIGTVADAEQMTRQLAQFYARAGCGLMNQYLAFRWEDGLVGIENPDPVRLQDLVGYQHQKKIIIANTEAFLAGGKANNILLYGEKGTGKSSSVKALLNEYAGRGLRMIELSKQQLMDFRSVQRSIEGRNRYFIIFIDDLSFEDFEVDYKYIKAAIEGSLEIKAENVLLYVTSNRRNLIRENWSERAVNDVHGFDSRQEKLSFADRFGLTITYPSPDQEHFLEIVETLAGRDGITMPVEELRQRALRWERNHHGRSGRSAVQFIASLNANL